MTSYLDIVKNVLTLDELYEIFESDQYKPFREKHNIEVQKLPNEKRWATYDEDSYYQRDLLLYSSLYFQMCKKAWLILLLLTANYRYRQTPCTSISTNNPRPKA